VPAAVGALPLAVAPQEPVALVAVSSPEAPAAGEARVLQFLRQYTPAPLLRTPALDAGKVGMVDSGAAVQVLEEQDGWLRVETRTGARGWLAKAWLRR
jgi:Bacterial SH3 domain